MTSRSTWKRAEREAARFYGTERTPLSGGASRHTHSDTLHERLYVEVKLRAKQAVHALYRTVEAEARKEGRVPVLVLREKGSPLVLHVIGEEGIERLVEERMRAK